MRLKTLLASGAAIVCLVAIPASAAVINLVDQGFTGTAAQQAQFREGFRIAAAYWGATLVNNVTINLGVGSKALGAGILGSTGSAGMDFATANWVSAINDTKSGSTLDANIVLPTLNGVGASFITNGVTASALEPSEDYPIPVVDDLSTLRYVNGNTTSANTLYLNTSVVKAIGGTAAYRANNPLGLDGSVTFSSDFNFDFDPTDGIAANTFDFIGVAIHEIGHALGFVSGVDLLDIYGKGNGASEDEDTLGYSLNDTSIYSALDMFRYSKDPNNIAPGSGPSLDLAVGGVKYFSIDGGATALFGNTFATGDYNGDGNQASHWKDAPGCQVGNGLLDPTFCPAQIGVVTGLDLAAYDAMGWNLSADALTYANTSTASIYRQFAAVPEPTTWAMLIFGFGLIGGSLRRRSMKVSYAV